MGADWETIRHLLFALSEREDAPGGFVEEVQLFFGERGVRALSSHFQRPMRLTVAEAAALELGLTLLRDELGTAKHDVIDRALQRVRTATTPVADEGAARVLRHVVATNDTVRDGWPAIAAVGAGDDASAGVTRTDSNADGSVVPTMKVRYSARIAKWIADHERGEHAADGTFIVEYPAIDVQWAVRRVLQYGEDAEILEPAALRDDLLLQLRRLEEQLGPD